MNNIAILAGDHKVGHYFCNLMIARYPDNIAFIQYQGQDLTQIGGGPREIPIFHGTSELYTRHYIDVFEPNLIVLAWWPKIVHHINKLGIPIINTHPSLLPYNRGKHPYYWSIREGTPFGVTIHRVDNGIDTGSILWQREIKLTPEDTGESAYNKSITEMLGLIQDHLDDIVHGRFPPGIKQDEGKATYHHSRALEINPIRDDGKMCNEYNLIQDCRARTFNNSHSGRRIEIDGKMYRIHLNLVEEKNEEV